jgi:hypothetical protein
MTIENMANRLGLTQAELDVLKAEEQAKCLPGSYRLLSDYLEVRTQEKQDADWRITVNALVVARRAVPHTFEAVYEFHDKIRAFIETLN